MTLIQEDKTPVHNATIFLWHVHRVDVTVDTEWIANAPRIFWQV